MTPDNLERLAFYTEVAIIITDEDATILRVDNAFTRITGYREEEVIGKNPRILQSNLQDKDFYKAMWSMLLQKGSWQGCIWNRRKNGELYSEWLQISRVIHPDSGRPYYVAHFVDLREVNIELEKWQNIAYHDNLTGMYNRSYLNAYYQNWSADSSHPSMLMMLIDLDRFKQINDQFGHKTGDFVLKTVAARIQQAIRPNDELVRLGGDEFLLIIKSELQPAAISTLCERIISLATSAINTNDRVVAVGASIGVVMSTDHSDTFESLYHHADLAMYHAKKHGGGYVVFPFAHSTPLPTQDDQKGGCNGDVNDQ